MKTNYLEKTRIPVLIAFLLALTSCTVWNMIGVSGNAPTSEFEYVSKGTFESTEYDDKIGVNHYSPDPTVHAKGGVTSFPESGDGYYRVNPTSTMRYADINGSSGATNIPATSEEPYHILVLPIEIVGWEFSDCYPNYRQDLINTLNGEGYSDTGYWESVSSFYKKSSYGKLNLQFDIAPIYNCGYSAKSLKSIDDGSANAAINVLNDAVNAYRQKFGREAVRKYDHDGDGWLDGVIMIYSCPDFQSNARIRALDKVGELYWAFCYWAADRFPTASEKNDPVANLFFWASASFLYSGNVRSPRSDAHTFIHEFGHMLGLDDYYAVLNNDGVYESFNPAGGWIMEDHNILDHDIWSKTALGWTKPYVVTNNCTIQINPSSYNGDCIIVPSTGWNGTAFSEFLIMELYTPTDLNYLDSHVAYEGRDIGYSTYGIRLWHVDARVARTTGEKDRKGNISWSYFDGKSIPTNGSYAYRVAASNSNKAVDIASNYSLLSLIDASGTINFEKGGYGENKCLFRTGDSFSFSKSKYQKYFPNRSRFNDGTSSSVTISFVSVSEDKATISFSF